MIRGTDKCHAEGALTGIGTSQLAGGRRGKRGAYSSWGKDCARGKWASRGLKGGGSNGDTV